MPGKLGDLIKKVKTKRNIKKYKKDRAANPTVVNKPHGGKPGPNQMNFAKGGLMKSKSYKKGGIIQHD